MYWINNRERSPFSEFRTLQREMNRLFEGIDDDVSMSRFPALNVWGNEDNLIVTAEIPGLSKDDININIVNNVLTISGEKKEEELADDTVCHRYERGVGKFVRTVQLPFAIETGKVTAKHDKGVLTITLPQHEATKPKKIEITAS
jgi:HSP20 family protein